MTTIKAISRVSQFQCVVLAVALVGASAWAIDGGDDFNDNTVEPTKWGTDEQIGGGALAETGGQLQYTVTKGSKWDETLRPWVLTQFPTTSNWEVVVNVINTIELGKNQVCSFGFYIRNWRDPYDRLGVELYSSTLGGGPTRRGFYSFLVTDDWFVNDTDTFDIGTTFGAVRIAFNSATQVLTAYYDVNSANGYQWAVLGSYGIGGSGGASGNTDWDMGATDRLTLLLYGYGEKAVITGNTLAGDDLATTGGIPYEIAPSNLTGAFSGVKEKCSTLCTLKGKLAMLNGTTSPIRPTRVRIFLSTDAVFNDGVDSLIQTSLTKFAKPGKAAKLKLAAASESSFSGFYLLAVDDSGQVLGSYLIP
ncbi:MAG: hypothetical protein PCFJNLEI_01327 [Verrucomicrobiae bacterium]|nr:hypothetical protein [Verrucomicrobiae bacterium]